MNEIPVKARIDTSWSVEESQEQQKPVNTVRNKPEITRDKEGQWVTYEFPIVSRENITDQVEVEVQTEQNLVENQDEGEETESLENTDYGFIKEVIEENIEEAEQEIDRNSNTEERPLQLGRIDDLEEDIIRQEMIDQGILREWNGEEIVETTNIPVEIVAEPVKTKTPSEKENERLSKKTIHKILSEERKISKRSAKKKISYRDVESDIDENDAEEEGKKKTQETVVMKR